MPLRGTLQVSRAKNSALYLILAALLTPEPVRLEQVPRLRDVAVALEILRHVGVEVRWEGRDLFLQAARLRTCEAPYRLVSQMRASFVAMGALLARCGQARISMPGGCAFGPRPVDRHIRAFQDLGVDLLETEGDFFARRVRPLAGKVRFEAPTVGGTQNVLLASALGRGEVLIENAALEPEVDDLVAMLVAMGARIEREGRRIHIQGVEALGGIRYRPIPDRIEAGTYLLAAAATRGRITLLDVEPQNLSAVLGALRTSGVVVEESGPGQISLDAATDLFPQDLVAREYPGLPTDLQAPFTAFLATIPGRSTVRDLVYHDRFTHVGPLQQAGARLELQERSLVIEGGPLQGSTLHAPDIRAGGALVVAALAASGTSVITGLESLDRGYQDLDARLTRLGAQVARSGPRVPVSI